MEKKYYNKLARDKVPEIIREKGFECEIREMDHDEYRRELIRKVFEEASGVTNHEGREHMVEEMADLMITIAAVQKEFDISDEELEKAIEESVNYKGTYDKRLYLAWSSDTEYSSNEHTHGFDD